MALLRRKSEFHGYLVHAKGQEFSFKEVFELYRAYLIHQYDLLNHRTNWFIGINAFLFATYGFTIQKKLEVSRSSIGVPVGFTNVLSSADAFLIIISLFGAALSILAFLLLRAAIRPIHDLHELFKKLGAQLDKTGNPAETSLMVAYMPYVIGGLNDKTRGPFLTSCIPVLVFLAWCAIFVLATDHSALFIWR